MTQAAEATPMTETPTGAATVGAEQKRSTNWMLIGGVTILVGLILFSLAGPLVVDMSMADVGAVPLSQPPSLEHPLGTDVNGRSVLAMLILGTPQTLKIGLIAGVVGLGIGAFLGLCSGYFGGMIDHVIRVVTDVFLTIPTLAILIVVASMVRVLSIEAMALIVAAFAWMGPTRTIRAQVLTLRERRYVQLARLSGMSHLEVIFTEILPNLIPYIAATLVLAISAGILAAIGLEILGLGPAELPSLGMMIFWAQYYDAVFIGLWWWFLPPIVVLVLIFAALFLTASGLDHLSNPRMRKN